MPYGVDKYGNLGVPDNDITLVGKDSINHETITVAFGSVASLTRGSNAGQAFITVENTDVRYWVDGTVPNTTMGHLVIAGGIIGLDSEGQIKNFYVTPVSGTAVLQVSYF
jgi:hypothetical protein